jgi:hypothetical protein
VQDAAGILAEPADTYVQMNAVLHTILTFVTRP